MSVGMQDAALGQLVMIVWFTDTVTVSHLTKM